MPSIPSSAERRRLSLGALAALIVVSLAVPAGLFALIASRHHSSKGAVVTPQRAKIGTAAPDFTLPDLDGHPLTLSSLRGRPVVLTFFASWCHPCEEEMPALEQAATNSSGRLAVVGVNYKDIDTDTRDFVHRLHVTFPTLIENEVDNPVAARYDVHEMPDTVFIDAAGVVRARTFGPLSKHDLEQAVASLLRGS